MFITEELLIPVTRTSYKDFTEDNTLLKTVKHVECGVCGCNTVKHAECNICGKMILRTSMTNHLRIHKEQKDYTCHICDKSFVQKATLQKHILRIHHNLQK